MAEEAFKQSSSLSQENSEISESTIEINIKTLESQVHKLRVAKDIPVTVLKEKIASLTSVSVEQQRLIFRGKVLKDDHLLSEYYVEDGVTLHMVARRPAEGQNSAGTTSDESNRNSGNNSTQQNDRSAQMSHSVVLGTVNLPDNGDGMAADIARGIGEILRSLGAGVLAPGVGVPNPSQPPNARPNGEPEGAQNNGSNRTQPVNPVQPGIAILNHQFPSPIFSHHMVIPDSLTTLSDFISRMDQVLQNNDGSTNSSTQNAPSNNEGLPTNQRGMPTPGALGSVIDRARQLLSGPTSSALSGLSQRLERESGSTELAVRTQIQTEAMQLGVVMQHLGAMLLELGRTTMTLRMGSTPGEAFVNSGPSVYISSNGPNPIMAQPFPLQTASLFSVPGGTVISGVSGTSAGADPARNISIHIHAGTTTAQTSAPAVGNPNSTGPNPTQLTQLASNNPTDLSSVRGPTPRTYVAAIPARAPTEASGNHVLSVVYPVQVRAQASAPLPTQPNGQANQNAPNPQVPGGISSLLAQISANLSNLVSGSAGPSQSQGLSAPPAGNGGQPGASTTGEDSLSGVNPSNTTEPQISNQSQPEAPTTKQQEDRGISNNMGQSGNVDHVESLSTDLKGGQPSDTTGPRPGQSSETDRPAPLGLGLGGLHTTKRRGNKPATTEPTVNKPQSTVNQSPQPISTGQQALPSHPPRADVRGPRASGPTGGGADIGTMISHVMNSPAFSNLLANVATQTGVGSPNELRSTMEQFTRNPAMQSALGQMMRQVDGPDQSGARARGGGGGVDFSRMIQQMLPVVSQVLGGGGPGDNDLQPASGMRQIDVHEACERIEQQDTPENIFTAVLESAAHLYGGGDDDIQDLVHEFSHNNRLALSYIDALCREIQRRLNSDSNAEN